MLDWYIEVGHDLLYLSQFIIRSHLTISHLMLHNFSRWYSAIK